MTRSTAASAMNNPADDAGGTLYNRRELRLLLNGQNLAETVTYPKDDYSRWDPHFQVGGPVLTDKMWFWAGYTPTMEDTNRTVTFRSNQQTGTYESKETTQNLVGNLTWQMSQPARLRVSGQYRPYDRDGLLPNPNGTNNPATVFAITSKQPNNTATGSFDYVGSNRVFFNTKVNYLEYRPARQRHPERDSLHLRGRVEQHLRDQAGPDSVGRLHEHSDEPADIEGQILANRLERRQHVLLERRRTAHVQGRRAVRAHRKRRGERRTAAQRIVRLGHIAHEPRWVRQPRTVRLLLVAHVRHARQGQRQQPGSFLPGRLDGQQPVDHQRWCPDRA